LLEGAIVLRLFDEGFREYSPETGRYLIYGGVSRPSPKVIISTGINV
jgi:hypothetical protein